MHATSVAVCTPARDGFGPEYVESLLDMLMWFAGRRIPFKWIPQTTSTPLSRKRDRLAAMFLETGFSHSLWIDSDVGVPARTVAALLELDVEFATAPCLLQIPPYGDASSRRFSVQLVDLDQTPVNGAVRVERTGFGDCLIRRSVFERMASRHPELRYTEDRTRLGDGSFYDARQSFFLEDIAGDGLREGEDYSFCRRWRALGGDIWALLDSEVRHHGRKGHFGREVWDNRAALAQARADCRDAFQRLRARHADLERCIERAETLSLDTTSERAAAGATSPPLVPIEHLDMQGARAALSMAASSLARVEEVRSRLDRACNAFEDKVRRAGA